MRISHIATYVRAECTRGHAHTNAICTKSVRELDHSEKLSHMYNWVLEREKRQNESEAKFEERLAEHFVKVIKDIKPWIHETLNPKQDKYKER